MKEYQRLVQTELAADYVAEFAPGTAVKTLHDPTCLYPVGFATDKTFNASTFAPPPGCTGFEGLVTSGPSDGPNDLANLYNGDFDDAAGLTTPAADFFEEQGVVPGVAEGWLQAGRAQRLLLQRSRDLHQLQPVPHLRRLGGTGSAGHGQG